ncbi:hypothetical protein GTW78_15385 [Streptomyces sp. SID4948]|nr:hypothetical protein [Streptomyces sp. SID4948]
MHCREQDGFPRTIANSVELVVQAVKEFLASKGSRPKCVQWQVPEIW